MGKKSRREGIYVYMVCQVSLVVKNPPENAGSPREENGNSLQCSCLENSMDGGAWWAAISGVTESWTRLKQQQHGIFVSSDAVDEDKE